MIPFTSDQIEYKEKTLNQLLDNISLLENRLEHEQRSDVIDSIHRQLEEMGTHINHLQQELETGTVGEPVADELFQRAAGALTKRKFFLAKKLITKLETIEPFYPGIERMKHEAEEGRASRRTRSIAQSTVVHPPSSDNIAPDSNKVEGEIPPRSTPVVEVQEDDIEETKREKKGIARFFQFHIVVSCLTVILVFCVMFGVGAVTIFQLLVEGN